LAGFAYQGKLRNAIHQYKFEDAYLLAESFSEGLIPIVKKIEGYKKYKATYIPLSKQRERYRGYNQSKLLADKVAYRLNMKVLDLLERKGQGETQVTAKTKVARKRNIRGVFSLQEGVKVPDKLILFDDVVTTGATVEEAVRVLKKTGAKKVMVVALAMGS
jgi:competence protein ComFC